MANCFDCGKKFEFIDYKFTLKNQAKTIGVQDELANKMNEEDRVCRECNKKFQIRHALEVWKFTKKTMKPKEFEKWKKDVDDRVFDEAQRLLREENSATETVPTEGVISSTNSAVPKSASNTTSSNQSNMESISADQLRALATSRHDEFKAQWDKNGLVQFKNDKIAILKRMVGQQVQFIVAYDKITEEGYRLMAIDEGITAQGSGFSGGASAYFYFQKMDFVK